MTNFAMRITSVVAVWAGVTLILIPAGLLMAIPAYATSGWRVASPSAVWATLPMGVCVRRDQWASRMLDRVSNVPATKVIR
jgi:hypothetical protein